MLKNLRRVPVEPTLADTVTISREDLFRDFVGEAVLPDSASERNFGLDDVGNRIWLRSQERGSLRAVCEITLEEFEVTPARLEQDLLKHIGELADAGFAGFEERHAAAP